MIYLFICDCGRRWECEASIKDGPPSRVICKCGKNMYQDYGASPGFILKGTWPGKSIKAEKEGVATEKLQDEIVKHKDAKKAAAPMAATASKSRSDSIISEA